MAITFPTDSAGNQQVATIPPTGTTSTQVQGAGATGLALVGNPVAVGVKADGANGAAAVMQVSVGDSANTMAVNAEGRRATYSIGFQVTPAASATDIAAITGSATKIVRVTKVVLTGIATAAAVIDVLAIKRSAADTAGTITSQTGIVNHDSSDVVATAVVNAITVNATLGATGSKYGTAKNSKCGLLTAAGSVAPRPTVWDFGGRGEKHVVLRGIADWLAVNLNGVQSAGQVMSIEITWTEE